MPLDRKSMKNTNEEFVEFVRLGLISSIFSIDEVHQNLYTLIEQDEVLDIAVMDGVISNDRESISLHLRQVSGTYNPMIVERLMASELLDRYNHQRISPEKIAFALYLQLIDEETTCWEKDENRIMKFDDGFRLISRRIGNEQTLSTELIAFLQNKVENSSSK